MCASVARCLATDLEDVAGGSTIGGTAFKKLPAKILGLLGHVSPPGMGLDVPARRLEHEHENDGEL